MTFDEAIAKVGTYLKNNDLSNSDNNDRFFYIILNDLREKYAPTIEMTENQKNAFDKAKRVLNTRDLALNFGQEWTILDEVSGKVFGHGQGEATNEQIEAIMQAWLHPETIKVVDNDV